MISFICVQSIAAQSDVQRNSFGDRINADLMLSNGHRHHSDLFSGSLGIPDVTTHVGSVIHAFETMARTRSPAPETAAASNVNIGDDLLSSHAEQPYELATISKTVMDDKGSSTLGRRMYRKSDGESSKLRSSMHRHRHSRFIDIPTPPPPPNVPMALPSLSHDEDEQHQGGNKNLATHSTMHQYSNHTLPHAHAVVDSMVAVNEVTQQFMPASQIMRMSEGHAQSKGRMDANVDTVTSKRAIGLTRGNAFDDSTTTIQFRQRNGNADISTHEHRRKLFGSHPNIVHDAKVFNQSIVATPKPTRSSLKTNYANINFRESFDHSQPRSQKYFAPPPPPHQKSDANNNARHQSAQKLRERSKSDVYFVRSDSLGNSYLNSANQINNNHTGNNNNNHSSSGNHSNLIGTDDNWFHHNSNTNHNDDDQTFLRGSTVSQSFIKNMKSSNVLPKAFIAASNNGFKRVDEPNTTAATVAAAVQLPKSASATRRAVSATRSYYKPQKYILADDENDYEDELRARYTEHNGNSSATFASKKPLPKQFMPSKSTSTGFGYRRQK